MEENVKWFAVDKVQTSKNNALRDSVYCDVVYDKDSFVFSELPATYAIALKWGLSACFGNNVYIVASKFVNDGFGDYLIRYFI